VRVRPGELVHVAGPNGCGKSSLLRVLAGVVEPRRGSVVRRRVLLTGVLHGDEDRILVVDEPWAGLDAAARAELSAGLVALAARGSAVVYTDHGGAGDLTATRTLTLEQRA
jgi:ABC-type multidrug transport system ATPase subunit